MPKLVLFVACERVSFDNADKSASLLGVLQGFTATIGPLPRNQSVIALEELKDGEPPKTAIPLKWTAFALWRRIAEDGDKDFIQTCDLVSPGGKLIASHQIPFKMTQGFQRNIVNMHGFPIGEQGDYLVRLSLREQGSEFKVVTEYSISVTHVEDAEKHEA